MTITLISGFSTLAEYCSIQPYHHRKNCNSSRLKTYLPFESSRNSLKKAIFWKIDWFYRLSSSLDCSISLMARILLATSKAKLSMATSQACSQSIQTTYLPGSHQPVHYTDLRQLISQPWISSPKLTRRRLPTIHSFRSVPKALHSFGVATSQQASITHIT